MPALAHMWQSLLKSVSSLKEHTVLVPSWVLVTYVMQGGICCNLVLLGWSKATRKAGDAGMRPGCATDLVSARKTKTAKDGIDVCFACIHRCIGYLPRKAMQASRSANATVSMATLLHLYLCVDCNANVSHRQVPIEETRDQDVT